VRIDSIFIIARYGSILLRFANFMDLDQQGKGKNNGKNKGKSKSRLTTEMTNNKTKI